MADITQKTTGNVAGLFYIDSSCFGCGLCEEISAKNFSLSEDEEYAFVQKQPDSSIEIAACEHALADCPVDAIGKGA